MQSKNPTHSVFVVVGDGEKKRWIEIGAAWRHKEDDGLNITLDALPPTGRLVVLAAKAPAPAGPK